jgi:hypothetical protein
MKDIMIVNFEISKSTLERWDTTRPPAVNGSMTIKGKPYDVSKIEDPLTKLEREFFVACMEVNSETCPTEFGRVAVEDTIGENLTGGEYQLGLATPKQKAFNNHLRAMRDAGVLDMIRVFKDRYYAKVMASLLISRLVTLDTLNESNDRNGFVFPLDIYELSEDNEA